MATAPTNLVQASSFDNALESFRARSGLTQKELLDMEMTTLLDVQRSLATIQKSQQQSRTMMHLRRLQPFLDAMEQYGKVADVFVNTSSIVAFIWGPMKFLLLTASNVTEAFNALLDGYQTIGEHLPLLVQYQRLFETNSYMQTALTSIFEDILDFHLVAVRLFKQKTWKQLFHATQRTLAKKIEEIKHSMLRHKAILEAQTTLVQYQKLSAAHELMKAESVNQELVERDRRRQRVHEWLALTIDSLSRHEDFKKERFGSTGQWLIDDPRFQSWFAPKQCLDPLLWLHGLPGAGKTVLASRIVEETKTSIDAIGVCFYCRHVDEQRNGFLPVARSMISQILASNDLVLDYLYDEMSNSGQATLTSLNLATKLLKLTLESCNRVYIVIDGLDEYSRENRKEITVWFQQLIQDLPKSDLGSIRCLFVSQDDGFARKDLSNLSQIKITSNDNRKDIESFCSDWHQKIETKFGPLVDPSHHVVKIVGARAQGMFLYAKLVTWNLYEQTCRADFEAEMDPGRIPNGLDQVYDRITQRLLGPRVPSNRRKNVQRLLGWLACAKRPLKWYEIQGAVAFDVDTGSFSERYQFKEDCKDLCASLVDILTDQTVTLVHSTTKQYLVRNNFIKISNAEQDLATVCLSYLGKDEFQHDFSEAEVQEAYLQGFYAFAEYAICFWALHTEAVLRDSSDRASDEINLVLECFEAFLDVHYVATGKAEPASAKLQQNLHKTKECEFFLRACEVVATAKSWLRPASDCSYDHSVLHLPQILSRLRGIFESIISAPDLNHNAETFIGQHYGSKHFKCARLNCHFFHQGFTTSLQRKQHHDKHDRSFTCAHEGCLYETIGFTTSKELQKHTNEQHGIELDAAKLEFPDESTVISSKSKDSSIWKCDKCSKTFVRGYNLKVHLRSHENARPFRCSICDGSFSRRSDCKRHEKLHSGHKMFICEGDLTDTPGKKWGCGRKFARHDALSNHLRSTAGRSCLELLLNESGISGEASQLMSEQTGQPRNFDNQVTHDERWESMLKSHPSLQWVDWNSMHDTSQERSTQDAEVDRSNSFAGPRLSCYPNGYGSETPSENDDTAGSETSKQAT